MKVSIIIAVYNEAPTVATLLERVWAQPLPASRQGNHHRREQLHRWLAATSSRDFVERHAADPSAQIQGHLSRPRARQGAAIRQGFAAATGDILLIQDADLEYDVADYPGPAASRSSKAAPRSCSAAATWGRTAGKSANSRNSGLQAACMNVGGMLFHALFNALFASRLTDPTSMYKVFRADCLDGLSFTCNRFDFDFELLGKLMRAGFVPLEIPVSYKSRGFDEGKKIRIFGIR